MPSSADIFYLLFAVLAVTAMTRFVTEPARQSRLRLILDAITVALCLFLLSWILVLQSVWDTYREDRNALVVALLYPVSDLVMLTIALVVLVRAEARHRLVVALLSAAILVMTCADSAYAFMTVSSQYETGDLIDVAWAASLAGFALAALISRHTPAPRPPALSVPSNTALWLPYVPLLLAGTIGPLDDHDRNAPDHRARHRARRVPAPIGGGVGEPSTTDRSGRPGAARPVDGTGEPDPVRRPAGTRPDAAHRASTDRLRWCPWISTTSRWSTTISGIERRTGC